MSDRSGAGMLAAAILGAAAGALGAAYLVSQTDTPAGEAIREAASPIKQGASRIAQAAAAAVAPPQQHAHSHGGHHGHAHGPTAGGDAVNMRQFASGTDAGRERILAMLDDPRRQGWMQPDRVVAEVLTPLIAAAQAARSGPAAPGAPAGSRGIAPIRLGAAPAVVVADVGAGAGFFATRIAAAAAAASASAAVPVVVVATEPQAWMREATLLRAVERGLKNLVLVPGADDRAGVASAPAADAVSTGLVEVPPRGPLGVRADVLFLANVYHHIGLGHGGHGGGAFDGHGHSHGGDSGGGGGVSRDAWLRATVQHDLAPGGHVVFLEYKPAANSGGGRGGGAAAPAAVPAGSPSAAAAGAAGQPPELEPEGSIEGPPGWMRLERSTILAEAGGAGLELVSAPAFLRHFNILVFRRAASVGV